jgi:hypothetical protein
MSSHDISHWSYRATKKTIDGEVEWAVREVYFDNAGHAVGWTGDAIAPTGDNLDELRESLRRMLSGINHEPLDLDALEGSA